jgi:hypothetical protein
MLILAFTRVFYSNLRPLRLQQQAEQYCDISSASLLPNINGFENILDTWRGRTLQDLHLENDDVGDDGYKLRI